MEVSLFELKIYVNIYAIFCKISNSSSSISTNVK